MQRATQAHLSAATFYELRLHALTDQQSLVILAFQKIMQQVTTRMRRDLTNFFL